MAYFEVQKGSEDQYIEVVPAADSVAKAKLLIGGEGVPLTRFDWGYRGFYGISPSEKSKNFSESIKFFKVPISSPIKEKLNS